MYLKYLFLRKEWYSLKFLCIKIYIKKNGNFRNFYIKNGIFEKLYIKKW